VKAILVLVLLLTAGLFAYETGQIAARMPMTKLEKQVAELNQTLAALQQKNAELAADAEAARQSEAQLQNRYQEEVPSGQSKELFEILRERMAAGVETKRLAFVIESTGNIRTCDKKPVTKRFLVQTPLYRGANDSVTFGGEAITVTAKGDNAATADGRAQAWFDPAKPVTVQFAEIGGRTTERSGKLPLQHSVVVGGSEYRFTIQIGPQGFVKVSGERCKFP
jgi:outer membrane murein-binding lipoprotein Lpp